MALALAPSGVMAESLREALIGNWALIEQSQRATDTESAAQADAVCTDPQFGAGRGLVIGANAESFAMEAWEGGELLDAWEFDDQVRGARLDDGRMALQFSIDGTPTHELTFWKATIDGTERGLLEYLGLTVQSAFYMKCQ